MRNKNMWFLSPNNLLHIMPQVQWVNVGFKGLNNFQLYNTGFSISLVCINQKQISTHVSYLQTINPDLICHKANNS